MDRPTETERIDVYHTLAVLWQHAWTICGISLLFAIGAAIAAILIPKQYEATIVLMPASDDSSTGKLASLLGGSLGQMGGGLMSLAGISSPGQTMKAQAIATLQSEILTERYIQQNDLLPILFSKDWDSQTRQWTTSNPRRMPTPWKANVMFKKKIRDVTDDVRSGVVTMSIRWRDPQLAAKWANGLVRLTNDYLKDKAIAESERNIEYLNGEIGKTTVLELRTALYSLLESEVKKEMLARGSDEYALKVIDPAVTPEKPTFPRPILWVFLGLLGGFIVANITVLARHRFRQDRNARLSNGLSS